MSKITCQICGGKKGMFSAITESWYRCDSCGVVCNKCDSGGVFASFGFTKKKCPKCARALETI